MDKKFILCQIFFKGVHYENENKRIKYVTNLSEVGLLFICNLKVSMLNILLVKSDCACRKRPFLKQKKAMSI